jgi:hypothetical protein
VQLYEKARGSTDICCIEGEERCLYCPYLLCVMFIYRVFEYLCFFRPFYVFILIVAMQQLSAICYLKSGKVNSKKTVTFKIPSGCGSGPSQLCRELATNKHFRQGTRRRCFRILILLFFMMCLAGTCRANWQKTGCQDVNISCINFEDNTLYISILPHGFDGYFSAS